MGKIIELNAHVVLTTAADLGKKKHKPEQTKDKKGEVNAH